jgi:hypothetical protein
MIQQVLAILNQSAGGPPPPPPPTAKPLIIFGGESNSGGFAVNQTSENGNHTSVKILNNSTLTSFETLHVSTIGDGVDNTHVGHAGSAGWGAVHGWEIPLATRALAGTFGASPMYLCKTGQGGSQIADWLAGHSQTYSGVTVNPWQTFQDRVDAAISLLTSINGGTAPALYLFWSQGINDIIAGISVATWKANSEDLFTRMRTKYPTMRIFMTKFNQTSRQTYNTTMDTLATEYTDMYAVDMAGSTFSGEHWDDAGINTSGGLLMDTVKAHYTI